MSGAFHLSGVGKPPSSVTSAAGTPSVWNILILSENAVFRLRRFPDESFYFEQGDWRNCLRPDSGHLRLSGIRPHESGEEFSQEVQFETSVNRPIVEISQTDGTLPQMEQIINLYLDKVLVYPDYVEIHLNNVPTNLLNPSQSKDEPALGGLHIFYIEKMCEKTAPQNRTKKKGRYGYNILVKLHRKQLKKTKSRRKGQKDTRVQEVLDSSKSGGPRRSKY